MSLPENPENRLEQYLQNIAEGSGDVPETPSNRLEQYLAHIIEHGSSGGVPTPTAADAGKVPVANDQGGYTLGYKADKPAIVTFVGDIPTSITLADNTIYRIAGYGNTTLEFPFGAFHSHIVWMSVGGDSHVTFPLGTLFIGDRPSVIGDNEIWEFDILDTVCVAGKVSMPE